MSIQLDLFDNGLEPKFEEIETKVETQPVKNEKKCYKCNVVFPLEEMVKNKGMCKHCKKIDDDNRRKESRKFLFNFYLTHPCIDCGESNPFVLQLDHMGEKTMNVSEMVSSRMCVETIKKEIEKCVVRCSNCHAKKTAKDQKWYKEHYDHDKNEVIKEVDESKKDDTI